MSPILDRSVRERLPLYGMSLSDAVEEGLKLWMEFTDPDSQKVHHCPFCRGRAFGDCQHVAFDSKNHEKTVDSFPPRSRTIIGEIKSLLVRVPPEYNLILEGMLAQLEVIIGRRSTGAAAPDSR